MSYLADIERVLQEVIKPPPGEGAVPDFFARPVGLSLGPDIQAIKFCFELPDIIEAEIELEDLLDLGSLKLIDDELLIAHVIAQRDWATHPHTLLLGGRDLVDLHRKSGELPSHLSRHTFALHRTDAAQI